MKSFIELAPGVLVETLNKKVKALKIFPKTEIFNQGGGWREILKPVSLLAWRAYFCTCSISWVYEVDSGQADGSKSFMLRQKKRLKGILELIISANIFGGNAETAIITRPNKKF